MAHSLISILMKEKNVSNSFLKATHISVYKRCENGEWIVEQQIPVELSTSVAAEELRNQFRKLIDMIGPACRILAGKNISGLAFNVFDRAGFHIFTITETEVTKDCLNGILSDIEAGDEEKRLNEEVLKNSCPAETAVPGHYFMDLIALQKNSPETSSKKALRPFLETTPFLELELRCSHLPPWLEDMGYDIRCTPVSEGIFNILIINRFCQ